jgi:DNA-binding XRE family transcriptional regulator
LARHELSQADLARGIKKTTAFVALLVNEESSPSHATAFDVLAYLSRRVQRPVSFEEIFGAPRRSRTTSRSRTT